MSIVGRLMHAGSAANAAWRGYDPAPFLDRDGRYALLWSLWSGTWRADPALARQRRTDPRLYKNTEQLWSLSRSVVRLYAHAVYLGDLSTDGKPLPDGTGGAIPVDPQTGKEETDDALVRACAELWSMWRWRQGMSLGPKYAAILGDCLIELVDDPAGGTVLPQHVWPGYVVDIGLDLVGNVTRYALEYRVDVAESEAYGKRVAADSYLFRKEVDAETFRYYKDGKPAAFPEQGITRAVEPNPYTFVPAVWMRHEIVLGDRGMGAFEPAVRAMLHANSVFSHALDYQRKQFSAPVGVKDAAVGRRPGLPGAVGRVLGAVPGVASREFETGSDAAADAEAARIAQAMDLMPMGAAGEFVTVNFDVGKTVEMVRFLEEGLVAEFPEARFGQEILQMTQVTAPGVERALGPIVGSVKQVRGNHDPQEVKLHQMAIAMLGHRLSMGAYPSAKVSSRKARYDAFRPFGLDSYGKGLLDFGIMDRAVIPETADERIQRLVMIEQLQDPWSLERAGVAPDDVARILADRAGRTEAEAQRAVAAEVAALQRFAAGGDAEGGEDGGRD